MFERRASKLAPSSMDKRCEIYIGRVVSHPCAQQAAARCGHCGKRFCTRHGSAESRGACVMCTGEYQPPEAPTKISMDELYAFGRDDLDAFDQQHVPALHDYDS